MPGVHQFPAMDRVVHGEPFAAALRREVERLDAQAVYVLASGTLARETDTLDQLRAALGNRMAGVWARIGAHTPRTDVVAAANAARAAKADLLVTVGGGSVTDIVILDPAITRHTPEWLFLSTGIRAVDHAVEDICSVAPQPFSDATSLHALRLLSRGLPNVHRDPAHPAARLDCQVGAWLSIVGSQNGVPKGASHGIGHVLGGTAGVPHGYTSCVMLPHVLRFNGEVNAERQAWVSEALARPGVPAADAVTELVSGLGLPGRLRDVGVTRDQLDTIARELMHDRWVHTNPRKIDGPAVVRELLEAAW